jgi:hypothetical protein
MKLGHLEFKEYASKKPVAFSPEGEFITIADVAKKAEAQLGSLHTLEAGQQLKLTLERYQLEPDFKLGIIGRGMMTKHQVLDEIKNQTEFGKVAVQAEMEYCNQLIASLGIDKLPVWPVLPKPHVVEIPDWKPVQKCIYLKLPSRVLFLENTTDAVTTPFANYRIANVHPAFAARGFTVQVLKDHDDIRANFIPLAKNSLMVYICGIGHGNYTTYTGDGGNHILEVGAYDPAEVKGKGIHFLSCETAAQLGPDTVSKGALFYDGYTENFTFVWDDPNTAVNEMQLFEKADSTFDLWIAAGMTAQLACTAKTQAFNAAIAQVPGTAAASWLTYDRDHNKLLGAGTTTIQPWRYVKICFPLLSLDHQNALLGAGELTD